MARVPELLPGITSLLVLDMQLTGEMDSAAAHYKLLQESMLASLLPLPSSRSSPSPASHRLYAFPTFHVQPHHAPHFLLPTPPALQPTFSSPLTVHLPSYQFQPYTPP